MHTVDSEDGSTFAVRATPRAFPRFRCLLLLALVQSDLVAELRMRACIVCVCVCVCVLEILILGRCIVNVYIFMVTNKIMYVGNSRYRHPS